MHLSPLYLNEAEAWQVYLNYSPAARHIVEQTPGKLKVSLQPRRRGAWEAEFNTLLQAMASSSISKQVEWDVLRLFKARELVRIGFWEFATDASIQNTTESLSWLARFCLQKGLTFLDEEYRPLLSQTDNSFCIVGLGKLGGNELNYSSDIDLIFVYNEEGQLPTGQSFHQIYNGLAKKLIHHFTQTVAQGQLYRVDLRLRPEGDRGPLVRSVESSLNYYSAFGEMWERLAMLKAGFAAGSEEVFYQLHHGLQPFCYARDMLKPLLSEIAHLKDRTEREVMGEAQQDYHVKLGRGGIRDIEFFVQGHQLLHGSKQPYLQESNTLKAIEVLSQLQLIKIPSAQILKDAYIFWRQLEHRLQMIHHFQTHSLPQDADALTMIAQSMGYPNGDALWNEQMNWRKKVRSLYDAFYDEALKSRAQETIPPLHKYYFREPEQAQRNWQNLVEGSGEFHVGRRTLDAFIRLAPHINKLMARMIRPDMALSRFASFVQIYGSRSLLYESFLTNPQALELLFTLFDASQYLGDELTAAPNIFEQVARGSLDRSVTIFDHLYALEREEGSISSLRHYKREQVVRIALRWLLGLNRLEGILEEWSALADACLQQTWLLAGKPELVVIGLGKLGGRELTFGSDLDVLFVGEDEEGARTWLNLMSEQTADGLLFPMDARLRPYGEGHLAVPVSAYVDYYTQSAQVWEVQSLTKARIVAGKRELGEDFMEGVLPIWKATSRKSNFKKSMIEMRKQVEIGRNKSGQKELEFKTGAGGLIDIEYIVQYMQMEKNHFEPCTWKALDYLERNDFTKSTALRQAYFFFRTIEAWLRFDTNNSASHLPVESLGLDEIARRLGQADRTSFLQNLKQVRSEVRAIYKEIFTT